MRKTHIEEITKQEKIVDNIFCNCCGSEINQDDNEEYIQITTSFGYFTKSFGDGERHNLDICEKCYEKWLKTFQYAPEGFGIIEFDNWRYRDFEAWKCK